MRFQRLGKEEEVEMDMTPMIDVVFNLIIFFMLVTQMVVIEKAELVLPSADEAQEEKIRDPNRLIINILADGTNVVAGVPISEGDLRLLLSHEASDRDAEGYPRRAILIRADRKTPYRYIAKVMMMCADKEIGIWRLNFAALQRQHPK